MMDDEASFINNIFQCHCKNSSYCDPHYKHIVTSDLRFIFNYKLRQLLPKGSNYNENKSIDYK